MKLQGTPQNPNKTHSLAALILLLILAAFALASARAQLTSNELICANAGLLQSLPASSVPAGAAYLSWQRPWQIVLPGNVFQPLGINLDMYDLGNDRILLDDRLVDYDALASGLHSMSRSQTDSDTEAQDDPMESLVHFCTNDFYLEIISLAGVTNPAGPSAQLTVHHPDPNQVFDLFFTPSLPVTDGWYWIARGLPSQTNFIISNLPSASGYFAAGTTNGMDTDSLTAAYRHFVGGVNTLATDFDADNLPDSWEILNFGDLSQATGLGSGTDHDNDGASDLDEFLAGTDPNTISFAAHLGYQRFNTTSVAGEFMVLAGTPAYATVMVNSTNVASAEWGPYNGTIAFSVGPTDGVYQVLVGLKGRAPNSLSYWWGSTVVLDRAAPSVFITSPATSNLAKPFVQIKGYCSEAIRSVRYAISNAAGIQTNLLGLLIANPALPTNSFQLFDLQLTTGLNAITLIATDPSGNSTTTNLSYLVDYLSDTNPPSLEVYWPQNGTTVSGDTFTLRAHTYDETAAVVVTGLTEQPVRVIVGRNGEIWVRDLPLASGTNSLALAATDVAGNTNTIGVNVVKSDVSLTINDVPAEALDRPVADVSGTINSAGYKVWVNGKAATSENGVWTAAGVPVTQGWLAVFSATAIPLADNGGDGTPPANPGADPATHNPTSLQSIAAAIEPEKDPGVRLVSGKWKESTDGVGFDGPQTFKYTWNWTETEGGHANATKSYMGTSFTNDVVDYWVDTNGATRFLHVWGEQVSTNSLPLDLCFWRGWDIKSPPARGSLQFPFYFPSMGQVFCLDLVASAETVKLVMRTKGPPGHKSLCSFTGSAKERTQNGVVDIPVTQVEIPGIGALGADGLAYGMLPDGEDAIEVTPNAPGGYVYFDVAGTQHRLHIKANGQDCQPLLSLLAPWCIVGQKVTFSPERDQTPPKIQQSTYKWTLDGTYVNESSQPYTNGSVNWRENASLLTNAQPFGYWISGDREFPGALYDVGLENSLTFSNGQSAKIIEQGNFRMFRPLPGFSFEVRDQVRVDLDNYYKGANLQAGYNLHFGINTPDSHNSDVGIAFVYTDAPVNYNTNTYGDYFITQALESWQQQYSVYSGTNCTGFSTNGGGGLDKDSPYGPIKNTPNGEWTDSPGGPLSIAHWLKEEDAFSTYLMFQPSSVSEGIAVPMYKGTWGWFGSAVNTPPWSKASGSPNVSQPIVTEQFPIWTNIIAYINTLNAPTNNCFPEN